MRVVKVPVASVAIGAAVVPAMPWLQLTWTCVLGGKPAPRAVTIVPGGPTSGVSVSVGFSLTACGLASGDGLRGAGGAGGQGTTNSADAIGTLSRSCTSIV